MIKYIAYKNDFNMFPESGGCRQAFDLKWTVREAKFEKETPKCVWFKGYRYNKSVRDYCIFDTEKEAKAYLISELVKRKKSLVETIKNRQKELQTIEVAEGKLIHLKGV